MEKLNILPKITWRWLRANHAKVQIPYLEKKEFLQYEDRKSDKIDSKFFDQVSYGLSDQVLELVEKEKNWTNHTLVEENSEIQETYNIRFSKEEDELIDLQEIHLKEGAKASLIFDYESEDDLEVFRNTLIKVRAEKNSYLKLVLVQKLSDKAVSFLSMVSSLDEGAKLDLVQVDLGAKEAYTNYVCDLLHPGAQSQIHSAYFVDKDRIHDLNYLINHRGKQTESDMQVNGALKDHARKRFAGTLDFKTGSNGSVGNEEEFVTLIDEEVKSIALPLLLASEHDIMGNHAASAGRIDQDMLFYLMSRGMSEKEAKALAVEAKMTPTLDLIPDSKIRDRVKKYIHEGITL
ncbi:MAG: SufD family Fe-S cluster assembly protein [Tissierellia bacterium]|nr:SufD family Fe-S cluster assembly protein [Tissierellia bacterium]